MLDQKSIVCFIKVKFQSNIVLIQYFYNNTNDLINVTNINADRVKRDFYDVYINTNC
jgi:hypothetical protein